MSAADVLLKIAIPVLLLVGGLLWWARGAIREGVRAGLQEARDEEAQAWAARAAASAQAEAAGLERATALRDGLPPPDRFALSLRAVFAEVWIQDLFGQPQGAPEWSYFWTVQPPVEQRKALVEVLQGGWDISDHDSALERLGWLVHHGHREDYAQVQAALRDHGAFERADGRRAAQALGPELAREAGVVLRWQPQVGGAGGAAWDYARAVDLAGQALALGHLSEAEAGRVMRHCALQVRELFSDWAGFGRSFQAGAEFWQSGGLVNRIRHGRYAESVAWLLSDPRSPWTQVPWDAAPGEVEPDLNASARAAELN